MSKIYFIDSENVSNNWVSLLKTAAPDDELLVFYTSKSPNMNYKNLILLKQSPKEVTFIECFEGHNALDFQLCTELGYYVHSVADNQELIIVSNDTGFDAVVKYWKERNMFIKRIVGEACAMESVLADTKPEEVLPFDSEAEDISPINHTDSDADAKEILYIIGKENLPSLPTALQNIFGMQKGKALYNTYKTETAFNHFLAKHQNLSLAEKYSLYCSIVFEHKCPGVPMPSDFPVFVTATWKKKKNLNSFRSSLQSKYGKEKTDIYYNLIKPHIKILDKIK